jgi:hypothetical protein
LLVLMLIISICSVGSAPVGSDAADANVYFHSDAAQTSPLFGVTGSEFLYRADTSAPTNPTGVAVTIASQIPSSRILGLGFNLPTLQNFYVGYVAWFLPVQHNSIVNGIVTVNVWLSSNANPGMGSGYFFALADINPSNLQDNFTPLSSNFQVQPGNVLPSSPTMISTSMFNEPFQISNHQFQTGRELAFFAGAGSGNPSWQFNAYFDGQDTPSYATVPSTLIQRSTQSSSSTTSSTSSSSSFISSHSTNLSSEVSTSTSAVTGTITYSIPFEGMNLTYYSQTTQALQQFAGISANGWVTTSFHDLSSTTSKMDIAVDGNAVANGNQYPISTRRTVDFPTDQDTLLFLRHGGQSNLTIYAGPSGQIIPQLPGFAFDLTRPWEFHDKSVFRSNLTSQGSFDTYRYYTAIPLTIGGTQFILDFYASYDVSTQVLVYAEVFARQGSFTEQIGTLVLRQTNIQFQKPPQCIIATAAYGSELASPVQFLRNFRDQDVQSTGFGIAFMTAFNAWYYSWAPPIAQRISTSENLKAAVRVVITPLVFSLFVAHTVFQATVVVNPETAVLLAGTVASMLVGVIYLALPICFLRYLLRRRPAREVFAAMGIIGFVLALYATISHSSVGPSQILTGIFVVEVILLTPTIIAEVALNHTSVEVRRN